MAISIHVVRVGLQPVAPTGTVLDKNTVTIKVMLTANTEHRVFEDPLVPSSSGNPTVPDYLIAEAAVDFKLQYMDQTMIVTYG